MSNLKKSKDEYYTKREYYEQMKHKTDLRVKKKEAEKDLTVDLYLNFDEAFSGCQKKVQVNRRYICPVCKGSKMKKNRVLAICK